MADRTWEVIMRAAQPVPEHPGGVVVSLTDGATVSTFARVAWRRRDSRHRFRTFKRQLRDALARAEAEADRLNAGGAPPEPSDPDERVLYGFSLDALREVEAKARAEGLSVAELVEATLAPSAVEAAAQSREPEAPDG